jgi:hypothetical protein
VAVGTFDVCTSGADVVDREANPSSSLGDEGGLVKSLVNAIDGIVLHGKQEAGAHLRLWCTSIKQSRCSMGKPLLTDQVIGGNS